MTFRPALLALAVCSFCFMGSGKRGADILVSFHLEANQSRFEQKLAEAVKVGDSANQYYFDKIPLFTDDHIEWFYSFLSEDGTTFGAAFKLNIRAADILQVTSRTPENRGKLVAVNVMPISKNSLPIRSFLEVDKPITDGIIVIWKGLSDEHLKIFAKHFPHSRDVVQP